MSVDNLPEKRFSDLLESLGVFGVLPDGGTFRKQVGFFDEDRLSDSDRCVCVFADSEQPNNGDVFNEYVIKVVVFSKRDKADAVNANIYARDIQSKLVSTVDYGDIFGIVNAGMSSIIQLPSGRVAYELNMRMMSSFCPASVI